MEETTPLSIKDILGTKKTGPKAPAYPWQDLALKIERELHIPRFKRNSIFKVCKDYPRSFIELCLADTKELCTSGEQWRYFLKLVMSGGHQDDKPR